MSAQSLEIFSVNGSHYVSRGGEPVARFNTVEQAEEFLSATLIPTRPRRIPRQPFEVAGANQMNSRSQQMTLINGLSVRFQRGAWLSISHLRSRLRKLS